jgi:hypothetical protein
VGLEREKHMKLKWYQIVLPVSAFPASIALAVVLGKVISSAQPPPSDPSLWATRAAGDNVQTHVDAEFVYHQQECIAVSVHVHDANGWHPLVRFVDCGHGLVPSNPLPASVDNGGELGAQ